MRKFRLKLSALLFKWAFKTSPGQQQGRTLCGAKTTNKKGDQDHEFIIEPNGDTLHCKLCNKILISFGKFTSYENGIYIPRQHVYTTAYPKYK